MELILVLIILVIAYLWWNNSLPKREEVVTLFSKKPSYYEVDVKNFDNFYAGRRHQLNEARLEKEKANEFVKLYLIVLDASKKGKKTLAYKDVPDSRRMHMAFSILASDPEEFFNKLAALSSVDTKPVYAAPDNTNESNIGLQVENAPEKTEQFRARVTSLPWRNIQESSKR